MSSDLTEAELSFYANNGYLSFRSVADRAELAQLHRLCAKFIAARRGEHEGNGASDGSSNPLLWIRCSKEEVAELKESTAVVPEGARRAATLLGLEPEDINIKARLFCKPPFSRSVVLWHQDEAFYQYFSEQRPEGYRSLNFWIALDDATAESGCLKYIPRSHLGGLLPHRFTPSSHVEGLLPAQSASDGEGDNTLFVPSVDERDVVHAAIPAGGANMHHCRTLHSSDCNDTPASRRAFVIIYQQRSQQP
jgi:hypothetical protein